MREKFKNLPPKDKARLAANARRWREKNREHFRANEKDRSLERNHGITREIFNKILEIQDYECLICGLKYNANDNKRRNLHVDHDHKDNIIRGLLCNGCNRGLGFFNDKEERLVKAIEYLQLAEGLKLMKSIIGNKNGK